MSKKRKYRVESPIKMGGTLYQVGDDISLTEMQAKVLHVSPRTPDEAAPKKELKVSTDGSADDAIAMIETTPVAKLEGFVPDDEDRVTVTRAWEAKQAEQKKKESES